MYDPDMTLPSIETIGPPDLVFYHADCSDGFGAAWSFHQRLGDLAEYVPIHYGSQVDPVSLKGRNVVMVDVSLPRPVIEAIHQMAAQFILIDHHKTAAEKLHTLPYCYFDMHRSGAGLAWDYAHPGAPRPPLINLVEARDLYRWENVEHSRDLTQVLDVGGRSFAAWSRFNDTLQQDEGRRALIEEGRSMRRLTTFQVEEFCRAAIPIQQQGRRGFAACVPPMFASEVGSALSARQPGGFGLTWSLGGDGKSIRTSWRSAHPDSPIDGLAGEYCGGGHPMAAGATLTWAQIQALLRSCSLD